MLAKQEGVDAKQSTQMTVDSGDSGKKSGSATKADVKTPSVLKKPLPSKGEFSCLIFDLFKTLT